MSEQARPGGPDAGVRPAGPNAAAPLRRALAQARFESLAVLRNGEQALLIWILPALVLVALARSEIIAIETAGGARVDVVTPGVLALAVLGTAFTSQAIATAFDRRAGVLRFLATTPLGPGGMLAGKAAAVLVVLTAQLAALSAVALLLGWSPDPGGIPLAAAAVVLASIAFTSLALLLAGTLRPEAVLAGANLIWVLLLVAGGLAVPATQLPGVLGTLAGVLPSGALAELLRAAFGVPGIDVTGSILVLTGWAAGLAAAAARFFRWTA